MLRIVRGAAPALVLGLFVSMAAVAKPELSGSTPADGATLSSAPEEIVLDFAGPVALAAVIVHESDGASHAIKSLPRERAAHLVVKAPKLKPGSYRIEWRALSDATYATSGSFSFKVK
jgi:copper resistance protein C